VTLDDFVRKGAVAGGVPLIAVSIREVDQLDVYGNVLLEHGATSSTDETQTIQRSVQNDEGAWLIGQPTTQRVCSSA
jgi:hypothetical protein